MFWGVFNHRLKRQIDLFSVQLHANYRLTDVFVLFLIRPLLVEQLSECSHLAVTSLGLVRLTKSSVVQAEYRFVWVFPSFFGGRDGVVLCPQLLTQWPDNLAPVLGFHLAQLRP